MHSVSFSLSIQQFFDSYFFRRSIYYHSNKEQATETITMSNSSSVIAPAEVVEMETTQTKTATNTSIDETDKLINSLDSMSIGSNETNAEKNDKLDAKSVEFNNNSQKSVALKAEVPVKNVEPVETTETAIIEQQQQPQQPQQQPQPQPQQQQPQQQQQQQSTAPTNDTSATPNNESQTDLRSSENDFRASEKLDTTSSPATATNNGLVETIINNNLTNITSANNNQLNNNAVDKDSDNNVVVNSATENTVTDKPQPTQPVSVLWISCQNE